ncbi:MAG: MauE/DoxX family redox-associated membrane protein [Elusimicrobiota bacterium]
MIKNQIEPSPQTKPVAIALLVMRLAAGLVLLVSGFSKITQPAQETVAALEVYKILPQPVLLPFAMTLPWIEYLLGGWLIAGLKVRRCAALASILFSIFLTVLLTSMLRGLDIKDCGCFGGLGLHLAPWQTMLMDTVLLLSSLTLFNQGSRVLSLDNWVAKKVP